MDTHIDDAAQETLANFARVRDTLAMELRMNIDMTSFNRETTRLKIVIPHAEHILIAEVYGLKIFADIISYISSGRGNYDVSRRTNDRIS